MDTFDRLMIAANIVGALSGAVRLTAGHTAEFNKSAAKIADSKIENAITLTADEAKAFKQSKDASHAQTVGLWQLVASLAAISVISVTSKEKGPSI